MKTIDCTNLMLPLLCKVLNYAPTNTAQVISCIEDGRPVAGVIYDGYNGATVQAHIWIDADSRPSKEWLAAIFDYPFNRLHVKKIVGQVNSTNDEARKLDEHFGFVLEAVVTDYFEEGASLFIYTMTPEQCRILNSPKWRRVVKRVEGV